MPTTNRRDRWLRSRPTWPASCIARLGTVALVALGLTLVPGGLAAQQEQAKTITIGETNSPEQRSQLLDVFKATDDDEVLAVTVAETQEAMDGIFDMSGITTAFSSTALSCRELGEGLDVTTRNIVLVTPGLYAMALVTAGIGDATLVVAAPDGLAGVEGMTALTGVFKTWEVAPCASGNTNATRQKLALEELTLTASIGREFAFTGVPDGVQSATVLVLETQKTIVIDGLTDEEDIAAALAAQEQARGVVVPPELRSQLVDLLTRLAREEIDWSTFAKGWEIAYNDDNTRITMRGDGIAIRNAQASATAEAAGMTATAQAAADMTATAEAAARLALTAEAEADMTATAEAAAAATQAAIAALTATAAAQPTATATPLPTATPAPFSLNGTVVGIGDGQITVRRPESVDGGVAYPLDPQAQIVRDGVASDLAKIRAGDGVQLTLDGNTRRITTLVAAAAPSEASNPLLRLWWIGLVGLLGPTAIFVRRRRGAEPFLVTPRGA